MNPSESNSFEKLSSEALPAYEADDGPLTAKQVKALRRDVAKHLPKGRLEQADYLFTEAIKAHIRERASKPLIALGATAPEMNDIPHRDDYV